MQVKASFWFFVCSVLGRGISVITTPIFTRLLTTAEYGQFSVFNSWLSILTPILTLNLYSGVYTQGLVKFDKEKRQYSSSLQGLCLVLVSAWTVVYLLFYNQINEALSLTTVQMLAMIVMIWSTSAFNFWSVEQRVENRYKKLVALTLIVTIAKPLLGVCLVIVSRDKVTARILGLAFVEVIAYAWCFVAQMTRGKKFCHAGFWKYALKFNLPLLPHYLSMTVLNGADRIMIEKMVGSSEAGIYNLAYSISMLMTMVNTAMMQTIEPWLYKQIKGRTIEKMSKVAYPSFALIAASNLLVIAFAPEIIRIFAPADYYDAVWVVPPVAMSVYFMFAYTFFAVFEFYYEKTKYIMVATTCGAVLNIVLNYVFIGMYGYKAAGYTTLFCYIIFALFHYIFMRKLCKRSFGGVLPYSGKFLFFLTLLFIALGALMLVSYSNSLLRYGIVIAGVILAIVKRKTIAKFANLILQVRKTD